MIVNLSEAEYNDGTHVGVHGLLAFERNGPAYYYARYIAHTLPPEDETPSKRFGRMAHMYILEPERYEKEVAILPRELNGVPWDGRKKACREWMEQHQDKTLIEEDQALALRQMRAAIEEHEQASALLRHGIAEVQIRHIINGKRVQGRPDWLVIDDPSDPLSFSAFVDLKTTDSLQEFVYKARSFSYDRQLAWYTMLLEEELQRDVPCYIVAVENKYPHRVAVYRYTDDALERARIANACSLERLWMHYESNDWPRGSLPGVQTLI